jgi:hypothetical protein
MLWSDLGERLYVPTGTLALARPATRRGGLRARDA